ncbi:hypothetical protein PSE_4497 [Pseudovibrio sp. FO-BEG1]|nr:hypothetical protein PSE_4497 [Pseudovibrio sp. FO-BEG1]
MSFKTNSTSNLMGLPLKANASKQLPPFACIDLLKSGSLISL